MDGGGAGRAGPDPLPCRRRHVRGARGCRFLAFRGGTALYKLHLRPAARYSEDIDLVQITAGPIGGVLDAIRRALDPWLGLPRRTTKEGRIVLVYRIAPRDSLRSRCA